MKKAITIISIVMIITLVAGGLCFFFGNFNNDADNNNGNDANTGSDNQNDNVVIPRPVEGEEFETFAQLIKNATVPIMPVASFNPNDYTAYINPTSYIFGPDPLHGNTTDYDYFEGFVNDTIPDVYSLLKDVIMYGAYSLGSYGEIIGSDLNIYLNCDYSMEPWFFCNSTVESQKNPRSRVLSYSPSYDNPTSGYCLMTGKEYPLPNPHDSSNPVTLENELFLWLRLPKNCTSVNFYIYYEWIY